MDIAIKAPITGSLKAVGQTSNTRPSLLTRFFNWFDSGQTKVDHFKADVGQTHKLMLIQGQVIPVKAQTVSLAPPDPAP
jgi:hypothetical protein